MQKTMLAAAIAALMMGTASTANADEGMWVPQQLPEIAGPLKKAGLKLDPKQLADLTGDPMGAVVSLGGCTASFVSPQGLVVTNHHCAYGAIQLNSTAERNLIDLGFNAPTMADELSGGPNARIYVLDEITDVTAQVKAAIAAAPNALARTKALEDLREATGRRLRSRRRLALPPVQLHGGQYLSAVQEHRDQGRAPGLCAAARRRQLRRRGRQLDVAAPHRRLQLLPRLRGQRRQAGRVQQGQRAVQAEALAEDRRPAAARGRLRDGRRLPGQHQSLCVGRRFRRHLDLDLSDHQQALQGTGGDGAGRRRGQQGHRGQVRQHRARLGEHAQELRRPDGRLRPHGRRRHQARARTGGAGLAASRVAPKARRRWPRTTPWSHWGMQRARPASATA
jgi:hypothetical protein